MTEAERCQLLAVRDAIDAVRRAFGAPGDHGYGTPQGDALFELYKQRAAVADALEAAASPYDPRDKGRVERAELHHTRAVQKAALDAVMLNRRGRKT
ncbi:MAG: hypothetical protein DI537_33600 [Stutzerimonas stutzeri]|nr:MAG: hypothetical protein DI537_33600 [Stutzerimonas stutzeri]